MSGADQTLSVHFEADTSDMTAAMKEAAKRTEEFEKVAERVTDKVSKRMQQMGNDISRSLGRIVATIVSVQTAMRLAQNTNAISDNAEAIGVTTQRYQEWLFVAKEAGVTQDQFTQAITRFSNQMAEARTRGGEFYTFLNQSAPGLRDQLLATTNNAQAFEVYAEGVARMSSAEQRALLVKKAFGDEAWRMQGAFVGGAAGLELGARRAAEFGQVLDQNTIDATRRMSKEIDRAKDSLFALGQTAIGVGATGFNQLSDWFKALTAQAAELRKESDGLQGGPNRGLNGLQGSRLPSARDLQGRIRGMGPTPDDNLEPRPDYRGRDFIASMAGQVSQARGRAYEVIELEQTQAFNNLEKLRREDAIDEGRYQAARALIIQGTEAKRIELARQTDSTLEGYRISALEANGRYHEAIRAQLVEDTKALQVQLDRQTISQSQFEAARANMAAQAAEKTRLRNREDAENIASQLSAYRSAVEGNIEAFTRGQTTARQFFSSLLSDIQAAIAKMLILRPLMDGLFGTGKDVDGKSIGGGGLLGGLIGSITGKPMMPQRAEGGPVMAGVPYSINERRGRKAEVFVPDVSGRMVPGERMGSMGGGSAVTQYNVDARYSDSGVEERIFARLAQLQAKRPSTAAEVAGYQRRFPTRRG